MSNVHYVYLMEDLQYGGIKIGISRNPHERLKALQIVYGTKIALRYVVATKYARILERTLHDRFDDFRADGEWFYITTDEVLVSFLEVKFEAVDLETPVCLMEGQRREQPTTYFIRLKESDYEIRAMLDYWAKRGQRNTFIRYCLYWGTKFPREGWPEDILRFESVALRALEKRPWLPSVLKSTQEKGG